MADNTNAPINLSIMAKNAQRLKKGVVFLSILFTGAIAGALLATFIEQWVGEIEFEVPPWYGLIPLLVLIGFFTILIHELGHVVGGALARFKFIMLIVGPFRVYRENDKLKIGLNKWLQMSGGLALSIPEDTRATTSRLLLYIAGGPLASLFAGLACGLAVFMLQDIAGMEGSYLVPVLLFACLFNAGIAIVTLLPLPTAGFENDGKQLLDILRGGKKANIKLLMHAVSAETIKGVRPREWTGDYLEKVLALTKNQEADRNTVVANLMGYYFYLDSGNVQRAAECIKVLAAHILDSPTYLQPGLWLEILFFEARYPELQTGIELSPADISGPFVEKHSLARMEAATLYHEEEWEKALAKAEEGVAFANKASMQAGIVEAELDWLRAIASDAKLAIKQLTSQSSQAGE